MSWLKGSRSGGFEAYARQVYGWAYRLLGRHHDALDVVQDVFLRWDRQCAESQPVQPMGWLRRVTVNRAIDLRRRRKDAPSFVEEAAGQSASPVGEVERADLGMLRRDIAIALETLSDMQRTVLIAKVYDEKTFAQIAEETESAVSTIKTHYLRAVRAVRDRLEDRWGAESGS